MGMQTGGKKGGAMGDINVTPLVDVVLVLLIIFMVVTQMLSSGMDVKVPKARTADEMRDMGQFLVVSITPPPTGSEIPRVYVDRTESRLQTLVQDVNAEVIKQSSRGVLLKGAKKLKWKEAYRVFETMNEGGYSDLRLATEKRE